MRQWLLNALHHVSHHDTFSDYTIQGDFDFSASATHTYHHLNTQKVIR
ncbi:hypothetical protein [Alteromonas sp. V450]|nr:hypothetical protein [Alteromonas sp. V450]